MGGDSYIVFCHVILNCIVYIINTQYFCSGFNNFKRKFSSFEFSADVGPPWSTREKKKYWGFLYWCLCLLGLHINSGNLSCGFLDQSKFIASAVASHLIQTFVCAFLKWDSGISVWTNLHMFLPYLASKVSLWSLLSPPLQGLYTWSQWPNLKELKGFMGGVKTAAKKK